MTIEHRGKIGIGMWDKDALGSASNDVDRAGFSWNYTWNEWNLWDSDSAPEISRWIPQVWGDRDMTQEALARIKASGSDTLLTFNEPDHISQSNMTVAHALELWPKLQALGMRIGSPAVTQHGALGASSWLAKFMAGAAANGYRVDFVQVHYYSKTGNVEDFKTFLESVHKQYGKPIWVTEWALADWSNPNRFTFEQQATYAQAAVEMMDDLSFVEKHAWFAGYEGGDGWNLRSGVFDATGNLTAVGQTFFDLNSATPTIDGTAGADVLSGGIKSELIQGKEGHDTLDGNAGFDTLRGETGDDTLNGGANKDRLEGGMGNDVYIIDEGGDTIVELQDQGTDTVQASISHTLADNVENLEMTGVAGISATGNALANRIIGNAGANTIDGLGGADRMEGLGGNDTYTVNDAGDQVIELSGQGDDRVKSWTDHVLAVNVEQLTLLGTANLNATGNSGANRINGNDAANVILGLGGYDKLYGNGGNDLIDGADGWDLLDGGLGNDILRGGLGGDTFVFTKGNDQIQDFQDNADTLRIDDALWGGAAKTVSDVLSLASYENGTVSWDFGGGNTIRIAGLGSISSLMDDLAIV